MGVYVEEEWRYKKKENDFEQRSLRASKSAFAYKINKQKKCGDEISSALSKVGSREVMVKFTKGAKSRAGIRNAIKYISREYQLELLDSEGIEHKGPEAIKDTIWRMQMNAYLPENNADVTKSLMFSPPKVAGVSKEVTLESVRKTLTCMYQDNYFVMAYHDDTKNPHVHVVININRPDGTRIRISGDKDFNKMKQMFAKNLLVYGYDVKATIKKQEISQSWQDITSRNNKNEYEVVEFGISSYQLDRTKDRNNYLVYRTKTGEEVTIWGKEIIEQIQENDVQIGDRIKLKKVGQRDVKIPVYSKDGSSIISWKTAKRNIWEIKNLSKELLSKHPSQEGQATEIRLEGEDRRKMHIESREKFVHEKNMLLNLEYRRKYEEEQKLSIKHNPEFKI